MAPATARTPLLPPPQRSRYLTWHPRWMLVSRGIALVLLGALIWGITFTVVGAAAGPQGQLFRIALLGVVAYLCGCATSVVGLPPLLGMLIAGVVLRNVGFVELTGNYLDVAANLRRMALVIILIRAGLGVDPVALRRLSGMVVRLSIIPSIVETITMAVTSHFLMGLPWVWGFLLGSVMAAVSPAVVVPCLFSLQDRGYGRNKGIPTLVIAAASFDDIISVSAFGVFLTIIYSTGSLPMTIIRGPVGLVAGLLFGICWGLLLCFVPERNDRFVVILRTLLLGGGGMFALFGSEAIEYNGAGPLSCIVAAFVACRGWRKQGYTDDQNPVSDNFAVFWTIFQPILFGIIGTEINLHLLNGHTVKLGAACLAVGLLLRVVVSVLVAAGGNLNWKEKIFVACAWFPKATVQAAIGPVALDIAREIKSMDAELFAKKVLIVAVLAILITAPLGAIMINILGPRLLQREPALLEESHVMPDVRQPNDKPQLVA